MSSELIKIYEKALKEKEDILFSLEPLRKEEAKIIKKLHSTEKELAGVRQQIVEIENEKKLAEVSRVIATLAPRAIRLKANA